MVGHQQLLGQSEMQLDETEAKSIYNCVLWQNSRKNKNVACAQLRLILCYPLDYSPPGSSVHGIPQVGILEWVAISFSKGSSQPRDQTNVFCTGSWILYR